jgi:phosphate transport system substrate-binding protein
MKRIIYCLIVAVLTLPLVSCGGGSKQQGDPDLIKVAIDETFKPLMDEEMYQFNLQSPEATFKYVYCSESEALQLFLKDSVRSCLATRELSDKEKDLLRSKNLNVMTERIATDAIALIVNRSNPDTLISANDVMRIVTGQVTRWDQIKYAHQSGEIQLVFDNTQSSTVRYVEDSICGGKALKGNVYAQKTNPDVIEYIQKNPKAIGIIGVDWLRNEEDTTNLSFLPKVRVMSVSNSTVPEKDNSYKPFQAYIALGNYPFVRAVYYMTSDPLMQGKARYFYHFLSEQKGQLIITKSSQLLPWMQVQFKEVTVN